MDMTRRLPTTTPSPSASTESSEAFNPRPEAISESAQETGRDPPHSTSVAASFVSSHAASTARPARKSTAGSSASSPVPPPPPLSTSLAPAATTPPAPRPALSPADKAYLCVGVALAALLVVGGGASWFLWRRHWRRNGRGAAPDGLRPPDTGRPGAPPLPARRRSSGVHRRIAGVSWLMLSPRTGAWGSGEKGRLGRAPSPQELPAEAVEIGKAV